MRNLLLMKFGGTSMGSAGRMRVAGNICAGQSAGRPVAIVVSAMSKVTDLLLDTLRKAESGEQAAIETNLKQLEERHLETSRELLPREMQDNAEAEIQSIIAEFRRIAQGVSMLGERPPRAVDEAIAVGERLSALLMAGHLEASGIPARAVNASQVIVTDSVFGNATPLMGPTKDRAVAVLQPLLDKGVMPVVTGFNGATADGRPTTLGRGGSDFSASILAAVLDAAELWIWTDVDGIMTADPRLVPAAAVLPQVTYAEAAELAYNGAKVLHPRTLAPLVEKGIPVWSKNSLHLEAPGTRISPTVDAPNGPRAVTSMGSVALVSVEPADPELNSVLVMSRALGALAAADAEVLVLTSSSYRQSFCFLVRADELPRSLERLESAFALELAHGYLKPVEVDENVGLLAIVGEGMRGIRGIAGRIFTAISQANVNIIAIAQGSSELTIAIVVRRDGLEKAVRAVHDECGLAGT
ncbi:MAG: aspartate kinase [Candidatus Solibacter usitatus]|nr:aspartate kinase [Candidatus Solibacter usitatus]